MQKTKKLLSLLLAAAMMISVVACSSSSTDSTDSSSSSSLTDSSSSSTDDSASEEPTVYEILTVRWTDSWSTDYLESGVMAELEETYNVDINWDVYYYADWAEQRSLLLASGDLPDAIWGSICLTDEQVLQNEDYFVDLTDYIYEYMPNLTAVFEEDPSMLAISTTRNGEIYGLPKSLPLRPEVCGDVSFINTEWLANLGLDMPETYEELADVLTAFTTDDPDGNGIDDTYGMSYEASLSGDLRQLLSPFATIVSREGNYMGLTDDGEAVFMPIQENYYEAVQWVHELYEAGALDAENFTQDSSMYDAKTKGEDGALVGMVYGWTADAQLSTNEVDYDLLPAVTGPSGNAYAENATDYLDVSRNEFLVTTECDTDTIGQLMTWVDAFYTDEVSLQTYYGSFDVDGLWSEEDGTYELLVPEDGTSLDTAAWENSFRDYGPKYMSDEFAETVILPEDQGDGIKLALDEANIDSATQTFPVVSYTVDQISEMATLTTDIYSYVESCYAQWALNGGIEDEWDDYLETLDAMGLQRLIEIQLEAYEVYLELMA